MGDDDERDALFAVEFAEQFRQGIGGDAVERTCRLVGQQQFRAIDEGTDDGDALPFAARKLTGAVTAAVCQPHPLEQAFGTGAGRFSKFGFRVLGQRGDKDVFEDGTLRQQVVHLEDEADFPVADGSEFGLGKRSEVSAVQGDAACGRAVERPDDIEQRTLTGPRRPDDGETLPLLHPQVYAPQHGNRRRVLRRRILFRHAVQFQQCPCVCQLVSPSYKKYPQYSIRREAAGMPPSKSEFSRRMSPKQSKTGFFGYDRRRNTMADDLSRLLYNGCDPLKPADRKQYVDFSEVRGGDVLVRQIGKQLDLSQNVNLRLLFSGHSGSGKSSELEHLAAEFRKPKPECSQYRYYPVLINVQDHVDVFDASSTEVLLAMVREVAKSLLENENIELRNSLLVEIFQNIHDELYVTPDAPRVEVNLGVVKFSYGLKRVASETRRQIRDQLRPKISSILDAINAVLIEARTLLRQKARPEGEEPFHDLVLIFDNMDRINRLEDEEEGEKSHRKLFLDGADQWTNLAAHTVYTVPLSLVRAAGKQLSQAYGRDAFVLPNVKTEERGNHTKWEKGRACLRQMLAKRVEPYHMEQAFAEDAVELLLDYCGGNIRQLMTFVRDATVAADELPIDLKAAQKAVGKAVPVFATAMRTAEWPLLVELELSADQEWDTHDPAKRELLERLCVLEYVNGSESETFLKKPFPWYAVHPVVRALGPFENALKNRNVEIAAEAALTVTAYPEV